MSSRKIIHIDMDCFYAAVEMRDNPQLKNKPIAVGGKPGERSVLCTSNYLARKFGVRSAMPAALAIKLCPDLTIIHPNMKKYKEASEIVQNIFREYTELIEPLSLDEAYLDVTDCKKCYGSATLIAKEIREKIFQRTQLTASAGIAPNKFIAKVASDWKKPNGQFVVTPNEVEQFVLQLDVKKIPGIGKVSAQKLYDHGIHTCADARQWSFEKLEMCFGKLGRSLYQKSRGIDERPVNIDHDRKSISVEHTFSSDLLEIQTCIDQIPRISTELITRLARYQQKYGNDKRICKAFIKMKFHDFQTVTVEKKREIEFYEDIWNHHEMGTEFSVHLEELTKIAYQRGNRPVRLLGVGLRLDNIVPQHDMQLKLI
ncbi:DNA polymerase IV [Halobacteriovorax sp. HLS]|uniref:DNA polymerase IV n=1 Tax=Halobacteriovorax sp. HLS TaxID=2234000 RepID=UPI000FD7336C|nr:DNA polymerase IV [Halobacteriovorax sp. HLS]